MENNIDVSASNKMDTKLDRCRSILKSNSLVILVLFGASLGFGIGFGLREVTLSDDAIIWIGMPGDIFMRLLKMTILPFVVTCIIYETASLDPKSNGKVGGLSLLYFIIGNLFGAMFAAAMYSIFNPGQALASSINKTLSNDPTLQPQDLIADLVRNIFPDNLVSACFEKVLTKYEPVEGKNKTYEKVAGTASATNLIGLIVMSSVMGMSASMVGDHGKPFLILMKSIMEVMNLILRWIIWMSPIGVLSLIAVSVAKVDRLQQTFKSLAEYIGMYTAGALIFQLIIIPGLYFVVTRKNPAKFLLTVVRPLMVVLAPPASVIAIPEMIKTCEENHGVNSKVSRFVIPLGTAFSRVGSCYFICLSCFLLINMNGVELDVLQVFLTTLLCFLGSIALPSIPSASIYAIIVVLTSLNMSTENIGILVALEWYTDRVRSVSNALNVVVGTIIINKFCKKSLTETEEKRTYPTTDMEIIVDGTTNEIL